MLLKKYNILMVGFCFGGNMYQKLRKKSRSIDAQAQVFYNNTKINVKQKDRETIC